MEARPTEFRGCIWDDGWEYDAPCVIYHPWRFRREKAAGNNYGLDALVEDICYDIAQGDAGSIDRHAAWMDKERSWRGWGRRFHRRRRAEHVLFRVRWVLDDYEIVKRVESIGPPEVRHG